MIGLHVTQLFRRSDAGTLERVLWIDDIGRGLYAIDVQSSSALPVFHRANVILDGLADGTIEVVTEDPWLQAISEEAIPSTQRERRDAAWALIKPLVMEQPAIFQENHRGKAVQQVIGECGATKPRLYRLLRRYWQRGCCPNALLPDYHRCGGRGKVKAAGQAKRGRVSSVGEPGVNVTPEMRALIREWATRSFARNRKMDLAESYHEFIGAHFSDRVIDERTGRQVLVPRHNEVLSLRQFRYWYAKEVDTFKIDRIRRTPRVYDKDSRALIGSSTAETIGPGSRYQIDATIADVYLVSRYDRTKIVGRPVLYIVIDVFSRMITGLYGQHDFVAADATNCPSVVSVPRWASEPAATRLFGRVAIESSLVLVEQGTPADLTQLGMEYRQALTERGFARGRCQVNWDRLNSAFTQVMGPVLEMVPGAARGQSGDDWLMGIARKHRKAFHPLRHILLRLFLADTPVTRSTAFAMKSRGPTKSKRDREEVRARWLAARQAHPAWPRKQLAKGYPAEFSWLYRHDRQWLQENSPAPLERGGSPGRVDWPMVDQQVAGSVRAAAEMVKAIKPPVRVTLIEIERRLAKPAWIGKRAGKLPLTIAAVGEVVERLEDFQLRRIAWAAHKLEMQGLPVQAWRIRRIAGLPKGLSPRIEARLTSFDTLEVDVRWC